MINLHIHHPVALALLLTGAIMLTMIASVYQACEVATTETLRPAPDAVPYGGKPNNATPHCLVFGKYCLGDSLRGR